MSTHITDIKAGIKTILTNNCTGTGKSLKAVYDYEKGEAVNYPFACVTKSSFTGEFGDNTRNLRTYFFSIKVFQERDENLFGTEKAERVTDEIADEILTALDNNPQLGVPGTVRYSKPLEGDFSYEVREHVVRVLELKLEVLAVHAIS